MITIPINVPMTVEEQPVEMVKFKELKNAMMAMTIIPMDVQMSVCLPSVEMDLYAVILRKV